MISKKIALSKTKFHVWHVISENSDKKLFKSRIMYEQGIFQNYIECLFIKLTTYFVFVGHIESRIDNIEPNPFNHLDHILFCSIYVRSLMLLDKWIGSLHKPN